MDESLEMSFGSSSSEKLLDDLFLSKPWNGAPSNQLNKKFHTANSCLGIKFGEQNLKEENGSHLSICFGDSETTDHCGTSISFKCPKYVEEMLHETHHSDEQFCKAVSIYPQLFGDMVLLPRNCETDDEPRYVNSKRHNRILKRRIARAENPFPKRDRKKQPYMHFSRHQHAMGRPRKSDGRFAETKRCQDEKKTSHVVKVAAGESFGESC